MCQGVQGSRGTLHKTGLYFMGIYALICYSLDGVMLWGTCYKLAELILSCVLPRTPSSGLRLRQDVLYRSHNATRFARRAHFYNSSLSLVHVFLLPHLPHIPASMAKTPRKKKDKVPFQQDKSPMGRFFRKVSKEEAQKAADDIMDAAAKEDNTPENKKKRSLARTAANSAASPS